MPISAYRVGYLSHRPHLQADKLLHSLVWVSDGYTRVIMVSTVITPQDAVIQMGFNISAVDLVGATFRPRLAATTA